ncbi:MAG: NAD(P)-dependent oxidoreductase [Candidatus Micrarchaeota archaeon]|nr:NAD(P)-dependent oxidoreductase [Candidatus Micrarchaeota archaeon]
MNKKNIFLTGGSGFIGHNLLEKFSDKYCIYAPSHSELDLEDTVKVEEYIKSHNFSVVIHAANWGGTRKKIENIGNRVEKNLRIFFNLIRCKEYFKKFIYLGSGAEYGQKNQIPKMKETYFDMYVPTDDYGFYKYVCSKYLEMVDNIIVLRIFGCYGKYEDYKTRFISNAICRSILDLPIIINNKNIFFDYVYVNDLAKIIEYFIENKGKHRFYNVTPDKSIDLLTIARKVKEVSGKDLDIIVKNEGVNPEYSGDNARLKDEIKGLKFTDINTGIRELYAWYLSNKTMVDLEKIMADKY